MLEKGESKVALDMAKRLWDKIKLDQGGTLPALLHTLSQLFEVFQHHKFEKEQKEILDLAKVEIDQIVSQINDLELRKSFLTKQPNVQYFRQYLELYT